MITLTAFSCRRGGEVSTKWPRGPLWNSGGGEGGGSGSG